MWLGSSGVENSSRSQIVISSAWVTTASDQFALCSFSNLIKIIVIVIVNNYFCSASYTY